METTSDKQMLQLVRLLIDVEKLQSQLLKGKYGPIDALGAQPIAARPPDERQARFQFGPAEYQS